MYLKTKRVRVYTYDLQRPGVLDAYVRLGFEYIRRIEPRIPSKFPTVGCMAELSYIEQYDSHPIFSNKGYQLIHKISDY